MMKYAKLLFLIAGLLVGSSVTFGYFTWIDKPVLIDQAHDRRAWFLVGMEAGIRTTGVEQDSASALVASFTSHLDSIFLDTW